MMTINTNTHQHRQHGDALHQLTFWQQNAAGHPQTVAPSGVRYGNGDDVPPRIRRARQRDYHRNGGIARRADMKAKAANKRAREMGISGKLTGPQIMRQWAAQNGRCYWTGEKLNTGRRAWCIDHKIPLCDGGTNDAENIVITSPRINTMKGDAPLQRWLWQLAAMGIAHELMPDDMPLQLWLPLPDDLRADRAA